MRAFAAMLCSAASVVAAGCAGPSAPAATAPDPNQVRITVLYDAFGKQSAMQRDWGYSALVEYSGKRILFDTGNNADILAKNAAAKGVDLSRLDFVVMSHRHGDHMGGMSYLLSVNRMSGSTGRSKTPASTVPSIRAPFTGWIRR